MFGLIERMFNLKIVRMENNIFKYFDFILKWRWIGKRVTTNNCSADSLGSYSCCLIAISVLIQEGGVKTNLV